MTGKEMGSALRAGRCVYGTAILSSAPRWPGVIASTGVDYVFIDTEHGAIGRETLSAMCYAYASLGVAPIVRIPSPDPYQACIALDAGAAGIVAPYLETVDQVQVLRGAVKFRPLKGERLRRVLYGEETLDADTAAYLRKYADERLMIVNIESVPALDRLDALLDVPDIDGVFVGPHDLSISLGVPEQYTHPRFSAALADIIAKARARRIGVGIHYSEGIDFEIEWAKRGANLIIHAGDQALVRQTLAADMKRFRDALRDHPGQETGPRAHTDEGKELA